MNDVLLDWDKLKVFYYVAYYQSFTEAAGFLNVSQPAISRSVALLEDSLKCRLIYRSSRWLKLTPQGQIVFEQAARALKSIKMALDHIQKDRDVPQGLLRLGILNDFCSIYILPLLAEFSHNFPEIRLKILDLASHNLMNFHEMDVSVTYAFQDDDQDIIQEYLATLNTQMFASPQYIKRMGMPSTEAELADHHLIGYDSAVFSALNDMNWHLNSVRLQNKEFEPFAITNTLESALNMAETGLGIASLPKELPGIKNLVPIFPDLQGPKIDLYAVFPISLKDSKKVVKLIHYLREKVTSIIPKDA